MVRRVREKETDLANIKDCLGLLQCLLLDDGTKVNGMLASVTLSDQCVFSTLRIAARSDQCHERPVIRLLSFAFEVFSVAHRWGLSEACGAISGAGR
jgi:hypothetical protein